MRSISLISSCSCTLQWLYCPACVCAGWTADGLPSKLRTRLEFGWSHLQGNKTNVCLTWHSYTLHLSLPQNCTKGSPSVSSCNIIIRAHVRLSIFVLEFRVGSWWLWNEASCTYICLCCFVFCFFFKKVWPFYFCPSNFAILPPRSQVQNVPCTPIK